MKVTYINHYLTDNDVANFARQSFSKLASNFSDTANHNLIKFLARGMRSNDWESLLQEMVDCDSVDKAKNLASYLRTIPEHWVPFGHPHISLQVQAPVPIARQLFKHKIGFVESEESRRYVSTTPILYIPDNFRAKAEDVKQGSGGKHKYSDEWLDVYTEECTHIIDIYNAMVNEGVCPEQARFILPQGVEVTWTWTGSLYALANVYIQRSDSHAQKEVQDIAEQINQIMKPLYPVSWSALTEGGY